MNGGTCTDEVNSYTCACITGYSGEGCEIGMCYVTQALFTLYAIIGKHGYAVLTYTITRA